MLCQGTTRARRILFKLQLHLRAQLLHHRQIMRIGLQEMETRASSRPSTPFCQRFARNFLIMPKYLHFDNVLYD
jgi:hypothetical protein